MLEKISYGILIVIVTTLLIVFVTIGGKGEEVPFSYLDVYKRTGLTEKKATCIEFDRTAITNTEIMADFNEKCEINEPFIVGESYFQETVWVVFFYEGEKGKAPIKFYDDYFHTQEHEIFQVEYLNEDDDEEVYRMYILRIPKENLEYANIYFE